MTQTKLRIEQIDNTELELGGDLDLNEFSIKLTETMAADTDASGIISSATVDVNTVGFGGLLTMQADGDYGDASDDANIPCIAMALGTTGAIDILLLGVVRNDAWNWTVASGIVNLVYLGSDGAMTQTPTTTSTEIVQVVGYARTADEMFFNPQLTWIEVA